MRNSTNVWGAVKKEALFKFGSIFFHDEVAWRLKSIREFAIIFIERLKKTSSLRHPISQ